MFQLKDQMYIEDNKLNPAPIITKKYDLTRLRNQQIKTNMSSLERKTEQSSKSPQSRTKTSNNFNMKSKKQFASKLNLDLVSDLGKVKQAYNFDLNE